MKSQKNWDLIKQLLECHVQTKVNAGIRTEGNTLLGLLAQNMVHTDEDVHSHRVEVYYPSHCGAEGCECHVDASVDPFQRAYVGAYALFCPRILAVEAVGEQ